MHLPSSGCKHFFGDACAAMFARIACIYAQEEDKSLPNKESFIISK